MNSSFAMVLLLALVWPFSSGKTYTMKVSASVPAASGTVKVQKNKDNGNTALDIKVTHLAKPANLNPSQSVYVVWVRPRGGDAVKTGAIGVDGNLNGELKAVTVAKTFDVFITAEKSEQVTTPSTDQIMDAHVSMG